MILPQVHLRNVVLPVARNFSSAPPHMGSPWQAFPPPLPPAQLLFRGGPTVYEAPCRNREPPPLQSVNLPPSRAAWLRIVHFVVSCEKCFIIHFSHPPLISWGCYHPTGRYLVCCTSRCCPAWPRYPEALGFSRNLRESQLQLFPGAACIQS